jgi:hypothetical protein
VTFIILTVIKAIMPSHSLKMTDAECEIGDLAAHDEEGYPDPEGAHRVESGYRESSAVAAGAGTAGGGA